MAASEETKLPFQADTLAAINRAAKQAKLAGIPIEVDWLIAATESGALQSEDSPSIHDEQPCTDCKHGRWDHFTLPNDTACTVCDCKAWRGIQQAYRVNTQVTREHLTKIISAISTYDFVNGLVDVEQEFKDAGIEII